MENPEKEELVIFAVNKDLEEDMEVTADLRQYAYYQVKEHIVMHNDDLKAVNTEANPDNVAPKAWNRQSGQRNTARQSLEKRAGM